MHAHPIADRLTRAGLLVALVAAAVGCSDDSVDAPPVADVRTGDPFETLAEYNFFVGPLVDQAPNAGVFEYTVAAPLWADNAGKGRYIVPPAGETIGFVEGEGWTFPDGTTLVKTFFFDRDRRTPGEGFDIIETRLLIRQAGQWISHTYVWDEAQTEATRIIAGRDLTIDFVDEAGQPGTQIYLLPDTNTCGSCHERDDINRELGLLSQQLNTEVDRDGERVNQLSWLEDQGVFTDPLPDPAGLEAFPDPFGTADLTARARGYLHANCGHCHRPGGGGGSSSLSFLAWELDPATFGVCKVPAAAGAGAGGRSHDIVPGFPDDSIVTFRMASTDPEIKMPELPSLLADDAGTALVAEWIASMPAMQCP